MMMIFLINRLNCLLHRINRRIISLWESGHVRFWVQDAIPRADQCFASTKRTQHLARQVPIRLSDLTSAFLILGIGFGLALFTFVLEFTHAKCQLLAAATPPVIDVKQQ